jgi:hypothetical protein
MYMQNTDIRLMTCLNIKASRGTMRQVMLDAFKN